MEFRHHQQIDQDQAHRIGDAHIAEGFIGDLPFAVPLQAVGVRVGRLADKELCQRLALQRVSRKVAKILNMPYSGLSSAPAMSPNTKTTGNRSL